MFQILESSAEFERAMMRARQAEGIATAKERGAYMDASRASLTSRPKRRETGWRRA